MRNIIVILYGAIDDVSGGESIELRVRESASAWERHFLGPVFSPVK